MNYTLISEGVYGSSSPLVVATSANISFLINEASRLPRLRARLCAHHTKENPVHEMLIAMARDTYIPPHAHDAKTESFHVIQGEADLVIFEANGNIVNYLELGDLASNKTFYFRIAEPFIHTVVIHSDFFVIHETTTGPFIPGDARPVSWAPPENNPTAQHVYSQELRHRLNMLKKSQIRSEIAS